MRCTRVRDRFDALFDGRLEAAEQEAVIRHLTACASCAEAYRSFQRVLEGVRQIPRPPAPRLELPRIEDVTRLAPDRPGVGPRVRKLTGLRVAAAVLLFAALVLTHFLAFRLGERENRDLAEIGKQELPRVVSDLVDDAASQLQFAGELAAEDPDAVTRVAFRDDLGQELERVSRSLTQVRDPLPLAPVGEKLRKYAQAHAAVGKIQDPGRLEGQLVRLEKQLEELREQLDRCRQGSVAQPAVALDDPEEVLRAGYRALRLNQPFVAGQIVVNHVKHHTNPRYNRSLLWIKAQSDLRIGAIQEPEVVYQLRRRVGGDGFRVYFESATRLGRAATGGVVVNGHRAVRGVTGGRQGTFYVPVPGLTGRESGIQLDMRIVFPWLDLELARPTRESLRRLEETRPENRGERKSETRATIIIEKNDQDR